MKRKVLRILELILAVVLVVSAAMVARTQMQYAQGASTYEEASTVAKVPQLSAAPAPAVREPLKAEAEEEEEPEPDPDPNLVLLAGELDIDELRAVNEDVLGWITIPDTVISYPVLQWEDNQYYLKRTWQKESSAVGSIFLESTSHADLKDFHTIVYGHNMRDKSMFGSLSEYLDLEYWREHPSVYLVTTDAAYRYDIFAAYEASVKGHVYELLDWDKEQREEFIGKCLEQSVIDTGVIPTADDRILTLSTCTGRGYANRWIVQALLGETYVKTPDVSTTDTVAG